MARVADFELFRDSSFDLRIGADLDRTLTANIDTVPETGEGGLLTWNVRREGVGTVSYDVFVNGGSRQVGYTVSSPDWSAVQESISTAKLQPGDNTVRFVVTGGSGTLSIGDVVLLYRQDT